MTSPPEPLESRFTISHAMLLSVLGRDDGGCRAMKQLIKDCHDRPAEQRIHGRKAKMMLRALWEAELATMRNRIKLMRAMLVERLHERMPGADYRYMLAQRGMFSYSGLTKNQVRTMREEFSVYAIDTGRICVAALNSRNVDDVVAAIANVIR